MTAYYAAWLTLLGAVVLIGLTYWLARHSRPQAGREAVQPRVSRVRAGYFIALLTVLTLGLVMTLPQAPYLQADRDPDVQVGVMGRMWSWQLTLPHETGGAVSAGPGRQTLTIPADTLVEFLVTAADVNHGMGVYDSEGRLLAQTQAMPGYTNRLRYRFTRAGTYHLLCLEYCGVGHHVMRASIQVE